MKKPPGMGLKLVHLPHGPSLSGPLRDEISDGIASRPSPEPDFTTEATKATKSDSSDLRGLGGAIPRFMARERFRMEQEALHEPYQEARSRRGNEADIFKSTSNGLPPHVGGYGPRPVGSSEANRGLSMNRRQTRNESGDSEGAGKMPALPASWQAMGSGPYC